MPQEEHTEWPSFETVLREVAPDAMSVRDRADRSGAPKPQSSSSTPPANQVADSPPTSTSSLETEQDEERQEETNSTDTEERAEPTAVEDQSSELPQMLPPLEIDTTSIRELLRSRASFDTDRDFPALEPLPEVMDLDNPNPDEFVVSPELAASASFITVDDVAEAEDEPADPAPVEELPAPPVMVQPEPPAPVEELPPPPVMAQPEPATPVEERPAPPVMAQPEPPAPVVDAELDALRAHALGHDAPVEPESVEVEAELAAPLNPFDPSFAGIPEEVVDDDGWISHSLHDIGEVPPTGALPSFQTDVPEQASSFDGGNLASTAPPVEQPATPEPASDDPFADLLSGSSGISFDTSGLHEETPVVDSAPSVAPAPSETAPPPPLVGRIDEGPLGMDLSDLVDNTPAAEAAPVVEVSEALETEQTDLGDWAKTPIREAIDEPDDGEFVVQTPALSEPELVEDQTVDWASSTELDGNDFTNDTFDNDTFSTDSFNAETFDTAPVWEDTNPEPPAPPSSVPEHAAPLPEHVEPEVQLIDFDNDPNWSQPAEPTSPADQLIDFSSFETTETDAVAADAPTAPVDDESPFAAAPPLPPVESQAPPSPLGDPEPWAIEDTSAIEGLDSNLDLFTTDTPAPKATPNLGRADLDSKRSKASRGSEDPWAHMRPQEEPPKKISFWEDRPKFFGGDERRKARARREARAVLADQGATLPEARACPNCGKNCKVDVRDPSTGRLHISCDSCRHMWFEDFQG